MSYSSLYRITKTKAIELTTFKNSWLSAPKIWQYMSKYCKQPTSVMDWGKSDHELWSLAFREDILLHLRVCHIFTYDLSYCAPKNFDVLCRYLLEADYSICQEENKQSHFKAIAEYIKTLDPRIFNKSLGIGLQCTSVAATWEEFNNSKGKIGEPWEIFEELKENIE